MDEESDDEPLLTKRKKKGVKEQEGQYEPFLLAIGGQAGPDGEGGGTGYVDLLDLFNKYGGPPKEKQRVRSSPSPLEDLPEPDIPRSKHVTEPRTRRLARAKSPSAELGGVGHEPARPDKVKGGGPRVIPKEGSRATERGFKRAASGYKTRSTAELERNGGG
jgi:hypothetical protein